MYLVQHGGSGPQVHNFAMSIAAVVDGRDGKSIELVQHTPKRDKGPQEKPARITLGPREGFNQTPGQPAMEATFERIQFKTATANNGKRRAAQQYYHLLIELFIHVDHPHPDRWIKIASRMSAPMVVRGRSPGHYRSERRGEGIGNIQEHGLDGPENPPGTPVDTSDHSPSLDPTAVEGQYLTPQVSSGARSPS
jgi:meiosis-specific transcription factor NDT80